MKGVSRPKPALVQIEELIIDLDEKWLAALEKQVNRHFKWDDEQKGTFLVPTVEWNSNDDTHYGSGERYKFEWYCWRGIGHQLQEPFKPITYYAHEIFAEVVALLNMALVHYTVTEDKAGVVEAVINDCKANLLEKQQKTQHDIFKTTYKFLSERGERLIRDYFVDLLHYRMPNQKTPTLRFNLNQDHLAYLLVVLMKGGAIEDIKEEVAEFASKHFLVAKGKGTKKEKQYSPLHLFKSKINNFYNGKGRKTEEPERAIKAIIKKGTDALIKGK